MKEKTRDPRMERAFLARVQTAMDLRELTQNELAKRLRSSQSTVSDWFGKGAMPKASILMRLPKCLSVNGHWLLTGDGPIEPLGIAIDVRQAQVMGALQAITEIELAVAQQKANWIAREGHTLWGNNGNNGK